MVNGIWFMVNKILRDIDDGESLCKAVPDWLSDLEENQ